MFKKGAKLYSIFNNKCPKCQEGDFFVNKTPFKFKNNLKLLKQESDPQAAKLHPCD